MPSIASVAGVRRHGNCRKKRFFTICYSWCNHKVLSAKRRNRRQYTCFACVSTQCGHRCTPLFHNFIILSSFTLSLPGNSYGIGCTAETMHARRRTMSIRATPTIAFFLLPVPLHTRINFPRRAGSLRIATQEFSMRVARMNPDPIPVNATFPCSLS